METATTATDTIYTEVTGTTCYVGGGRGTVTGLHRNLGRTVAAFVKMDAGPMLYVTLGHATGERDAWHTVTDMRRIDRAEFDRINELDTLAHELGWRS